MEERSTTRSAAVAAAAATVKEPRRTADKTPLPEAVARNLPVGLFVARSRPDGATWFEYLSPVWDTILGIDHRAAMADPTIAFLTVFPDDLPGLMARVRQLYVDEQPFEWVGRVVVHGAIRVVRVRSLPREWVGDELVTFGFIEDVTERNRVAEALRVSEERHRVIAENARDVIWTVSPDGAITFISPSVERLSGFTVDEAMALPPGGLLMPESAAASARYLAGIRSAAMKGRPAAPYRGEQAYRCKDGTTVWCDVMAYPVVDEGGRLIELLGVSRDLTERKRHETELIAAHEETRSANDALRVAIADLAEAQRVAQVGSWSIDAATGEVTWSDEMFRIHGLVPGGPVPPARIRDAAYPREVLEIGRAHV